VTVQPCRGHCVQCDFKDCMYAFHVRCGVKAGLIGAWDEMDEMRKFDDDDDKDGWKLYLFCPTHKQQGRNIVKNNPNPKQVLAPSVDPNNIYLAEQNIQRHAWKNVNKFVQIVNN
jgi:hypothetical protein